MDSDIMDRYPAVVIPEPNSGCWLCVANNNQDGYGRIRLSKKLVAAHRLSYELSVGPIPDGYQIDHLCRNRCCVNPTHLEAVTFAENKRRADAVNRGTPDGYCKAMHPLDADNLIIRKDGRKGCRKCRAIWDASYHQRRGATLRKLNKAFS